jgi:cytochrome c peroxidase
MRAFTPLLAASLLVACGEDAPSNPPPAPPAARPAQPAPANGPDAGAIADKAKVLFKPLPEWMGDKASEDMVALGRQLYYEKRLSKNQDIACNSCHQLDNFGVDGVPTSPGHKGARGDRNSPTSYNAALHIAQFWDGRAKDVEEQAGGPILAAPEMAMPNEAAAVAVISSIPDYGPMFQKAFGDDKVEYARIQTAIGAFERGLVTPSPFDKFLGGDLTALNQQQLEGLQTFMDVNCTMCHSGVAVGGAGFFKLGMVVPYETEDIGRMKVTENEADKHVFKVPSLRNITKTGPYFHDGSIKDLDQAVQLMGKHQLGKDLTDDQVKSIIHFLDALTGAPDAEFIQEPAALANGPKTPAPDPS